MFWAGRHFNVEFDRNYGVWQALWESLLSISDSLAQSADEEHMTESLKPLVDFWMQTVRPHQEALLSIDQAERDHAGD